MVEMNLLKGSLNLKHPIDLIKYRIAFAKKYPFWFKPDGICVFVGPQGSGKTLSAVQYAINLLKAYPHCILVSNLQLKDYPVVTFEEFLSNNEFITIDKYLEENSPKDKELEEVEIKTLKEQYNKLRDEQYDIYLHTNRVFPFNNNDDFMIYKNQERGVIFLVDEIQLYLNSLESKNINMEVITQLSQQRKQRLHIICTSQVFGRMAKPLREQFSCVMLCKCLLWKSLQCNALIDRDSIEGESTGTELHGIVKKKFWWWHSPELYDSYDTYYVIERNKFVSGEQQLQNLYNIDTNITVEQQPQQKGVKSKKCA